MRNAIWGILAPAALGLVWGCSGVSALDRAQAAYDAGDIDGAITAATESIDQEGGAPDAYLVRGKCFDKKADFPRAIADFDQARQGAPDRGEPALRLVHCYLEAGRPSDASTLVDDLLRKRYPNYSTRDQMLTQALRGEVSLTVQDYPAAVDSLGQALRVARTSRPLASEPMTGVVCYNLSRAQFEQGSFKASRDAFQSYLQVAEASGRPPEDKDLYTMAVLQFLAGDVPESKKIGAVLGPEARARLDGILTGDTFSVGALYDFKHKQDEKDGSIDSNP